MRRGLAFCLVIMLGLLAVQIASAHATLVRSDPPANSVLASPPTEIRLWFSEAVEPEFSHFTLRDSHNQTVDTLPSQVDPSDAKQMFLKLGKLPNGVYTVVWQTLSAEDGHAINGSFPITIGSAVAGAGAVVAAPETIPPDSTAVRWINLISLALAVGSVGFLLFVWQPAAFPRQPDLERRLNVVIALGWVLTGIMGVLMLLLQVSTAAQVSLIASATNPALMQVITQTRYGSLWLARLILWLLLGGVLYRALVKDGERLYWAALALGGAILLTNSLYSHAAAAQDATAAVFADWLHLGLTALWIGGLVQFFNVIVLVWRRPSLGVPALSTLVGYFSNFARVAVVGLIVTGLYAAWLEVGSLDGLLTTLYGQVLIVKAILILPLLGIAGINLLFTHRALQAGQSIWAGRLRGLVGLEIALTIAILGVVGALTSLNTPRNDLTQRAEQTAPTPISETQTTNGVRIQLTISPGVVGQNTFTLALQDAQGQPISDATLIRLRFDDLTHNLGESELRITQTQSGSYSVSGANLSQPGRWRIRTMIERPDQYDTVVDFKPNVQAAALPLFVDPNAPLPNHVAALLLAGVLAFGIGGFFIAQSRWPSGAALLSCGLLLMGGVCLISVAGDVTSGADALAAAAQADPKAVVADCGHESSGGALQITSPADGATVQADPLVLHVTNLTDGEMQTYVDGNLTSRNTGTLIALTGLSPGSHAICVVAGNSPQASALARDGIHVVTSTTIENP